MWEVLSRAPLGSNIQRKFVMFIASILVACFGYIFAVAPTAHAADAQWSGDTISYNGNKYKGENTASQNDGTELKAGTAYYQYNLSAPTNGSATKAFIIYFAPGADPPLATEATLTNYTLTDGKLANKSSNTTITIEPDPNYAGAQGSTSGTAYSSCAVDGIGWIVCPVTNFLAKGMDLIFEYIDGFLEVRPLATGQDQPMYRAWSVMKDVANILFIIGFLVLIYAQITGGMVSNYSIKKMLPRIIIAAILVNISYILCTLLIDIFNILGYSAQDLFIQIRNTITASDQNNWEVINAESLTSLILSGGTIAAGAGIGTYLGIAAVSTSMAGGAGIGGLIILLLPLLIGMVFVVLITFLILAARQAIITILVIVAPIAFVAYLLPNTEKWFNQWRDIFLKMLFVFPAFSVIFGGSQLAAAVIIQNATSVNIILLAFAVQVAPLAITPLLLKLGGGILNRFAGVVNNPTKGVFDRGKTWARERSEENKAAGLNALSQRAKRNGFAGLKSDGSGGRARRSRMHPYNMALNRDQNRRYREQKKAADEAHTEGLFGQTNRGRDLYNRNQDASNEKHLGEEQNRLNYQRGMSNANLVSTSAENQQNLYRRQIHRDAAVAKGQGSVYEEALADHAERDLQESIRDSAELRTTREHSIVNKGVAEEAKKLVENSGKLALKRTIKQDDVLTQQVIQAHEFEKQAAEYENYVTKAAEAAYDNRSRTNAEVRSLRLESHEATQKASAQEAETKTFIANVETIGDAAPGLADRDKDIAERIQQYSRDVEMQSQAQNSAQLVQRRRLANDLKDTPGLQTIAAGIDYDGGDKRVLAAAKAAVTKEVMEKTDNIQNTMDYDKQSNIQQLGDEFAGVSIEEKIAHARLLAKSGPGVKKLRQVLTDWTADKDPASDDMMMLKEILANDQTFSKASRDFEVWGNNEGTGTGEFDSEGNEIQRIYENFGEVAEKPGVWQNITGQRFASMKEPAQRHALELLQRQPNGETLVRKFATRVLDDPSVRSGVKGSPLDMLKNARAGIADLEAPRDDPPLEDT